MSNRTALSYHVGQCGVQMGSALWELYNFEHDIDASGSRNVPDPGILGTNLNNFETFYYETASGKYVPKALFIDSEPSVIDSLRMSALGGMIHADYMINSDQDCRNIMGLAWFPTYCGQGFHNIVKDRTRKLREVCDSVSGALYYLSTCGGTGTGFVCKVLTEMRDADPKAVNYAIAHTVSPSIAGNPLETYNTVAYMGMTRYDNLFMNMHILYDNEAMYRQAARLYGEEFPVTYKHLNQLVAMSMSSCTASLRFDGQLNVDLNEFQTNLVPIPTLNNMFASIAPLDMDEDKELMSTRDITLQAFTQEAYMCSVDPFAFALRWDEEETEETWPPIPWMEEANEMKAAMEAKYLLIPKQNWTMNHKFIAACVMYRGDLMPATINRAMQSLTQKRNPQFVAWVPAGFKVGINSPPMRTPESWPAKDMSRSVSCIINNSVIAEKLKQIMRNYRYIQSMNGYGVWSAQGGLEQDLLDNCQSGIAQQIGQYQYCMTERTDIEKVRAELAARPVKITKLE